MRKSPLIFPAALVLAMALTFSCSGGDDNDESPVGGVSNSEVSLPSSGSVIVLSSSSAVHSIALSSSATLSGSSNTSSEGDSDFTGTSGTFTDNRDNKFYKWVKIGSQIWMAENLNYVANGSKCGNGSKLTEDNTTTCDTYGRLYNWVTAMASSASSIATPSGVQGVCPNSWHLPSRAEWNTLIKFIAPNCPDNSPCADVGTKLKAAKNWDSYSGIPVGTDNYGFSALPGGDGLYVGLFEDVGKYGGWWSASEQYKTYGNYTTATGGAYVIYIGYSSKDLGIIEDDDADDKRTLLSVRCIRD